MGIDLNNQELWKLALWVIALGGYIAVLVIGLIHAAKLREAVSRLEQILGWALVLHRKNHDAAANSGPRAQDRIER